VKLVFVASNHASHTDYAAEALARGKDVYCEKPVSVTEEQAGRLFHAVRAAEAAGRGRIYAGYNRPHSAAVRTLRARCVHLPLWITLLGGVCLALALARREAATRAYADRAAGKPKPSEEVSHFERINACHHLRYALLSLAVERLADACAADLLRESEEFNALMRQYCDGAMSRSDSAMKSLLRRHGLDSAP
jgi:hypothetical protein